MLFCFKKAPVAVTYAGKTNKKLARLGPLFTLSTITTSTATDLPRGKLLTLCVHGGVRERERGCSIYHLLAGFLPFLVKPLFLLPGNPMLKVSTLSHLQPGCLAENPAPLPLRLSVTQ